MAAQQKANAETELISDLFDRAKWEERERIGICHVAAFSADWTHWRSFDRVQLWQAVLLSLNVDARPMGYLSEGDDEFRAIAIALDEMNPPTSGRVYKRLEIATSHLGGALPAVEGVAALPEKTRVRLSDFARWAISVAYWELPPMLLDLAADGAPASADGDPPLVKAARMAHLHFARLRAKGKGWPTDEVGVEWLKLQKLITTTPEGLAIMKMIRPRDLPRGPRSGRADDE